MTVTSTSPRGVYRLLLVTFSICFLVDLRCYGRVYAYEVGNESAVTTVGGFSRYSSRPRWAGYSDVRTLEVLSRIDVYFVR